MIKDHILVLGAGPGGYTAAFYAADQGYKVTLVDTNYTPGGVCLHSGCIPSKAFLHIAKLITEARQCRELGVGFNDPSIDINRLRDWKEKIISKMSEGLVALCKKRGVSFINGRGSFESSNTMKVSDRDSIVFDRCIIATGSQPIMPSQFLRANSCVMDSTTALSLSDIPEKLLVVGGGYIGLEMGAVYSALGSRVTIVEMKNGLLPNVDRDLVRPLHTKLNKEFESILLGTKITAIKENNQSACVTMVNAKDMVEKAFNKILVSVGRRPNIDAIGLEYTNVELDDNGFIKANLKGQTSDLSILAIGDVVGEPMLAHKASHEARIAVDGLKGNDYSLKNRVIPAVVFTDPEIAWCGLTELEAKNNSIDVKVAKFPWGASGRAHTLDRIDGLTKLVVEPETQRVLGVGITGHGAGELIAEGVLAINMGANVEDLSRCIHPHPTLSETLMESADVYLGTATHIFKRAHK